MLEERPDEATYSPKLIRDAPASAMRGTAKSTICSNTHTSVSFPRRPSGALNSKSDPEQSALPRPGDTQQAGDKAKPNVQNATLWGESTDGRPADSRRSLWDAVRKSGTAIAAQTVNFATLTGFPFNSTMLDMASAAEGLSIRDTAYHAWVAVRRALADQSLQQRDIDALATAALDHYFVELGAALMDMVAGPHFTFLLPHIGSRGAIASHALRMIGLFETKDINRERIVISIPATEEGIAAAQTLETQHGVRTNLYLVSGFLHALVCVEASASAITFSCDALNFMTTSLSDSMEDVRTRHGSERQWVAEIQATAEYLDLHNCKTQSMVIDLCGIPAADLLHQIDRISLRERDFEDKMQSIRRPANSNPGLQARQMQHPTRFLDRDKGFLRVLDSQARLNAEKVLYHGLRQLRRAKMGLLQVLKEEIRNQVGLQRVDAVSLAAMYRGDLVVEQKRAAQRATQKARPTADQSLWATKKINPRMEHLGYRLAEMYWSERQEVLQLSSPPMDLAGDAFQTKPNGSLGKWVESAPEDPFADVLQEYLGHSTNTLPQSCKRVFKARKSGATASSPGRAVDGPRANRRRDEGKR